MIIAIRDRIRLCLKSETVMFSKTVLRQIASNKCGIKDEEHLIDTLLFGDFEYERNCIGECLYNSKFIVLIACSAARNEDTEYEVEEAISILTIMRIPNPRVVFNERKKRQKKIALSASMDNSGH